VTAAMTRSTAVKISSRNGPQRDELALSEASRHLAVIGESYGELNEVTHVGRGKSCRHQVSELLHLGLCVRPIHGASRSNACPA
jgi:hypothetical protein